MQPHSLVCGFRGESLGRIPKVLMVGNNMHPISSPTLCLSWPPTKPLALEFEKYPSRLLSAEN